MTDITRLPAEYSRIVLAAPHGQGSSVRTLQMLTLSYRESKLLPGDCRYTHKDKDRYERKCLLLLGVMEHPKE